MTETPITASWITAAVSLGRCLSSALAIVHTRHGGSMPGFLSLMCVIDCRVQVLTGAVLVGLAAFALTLV